MDLDRQGWGAPHTTLHLVALLSLGAVALSTFVGCARSRGSQAVEEPAPPPATTERVQQPVAEPSIFEGAGSSLVPGCLALHCSTRPTMRATSEQRCSCSEAI